MLQRLSRFISGIYSPLLMLVLFAAVCGFFMLFNFSHFPVPISNPQLVELSGGKGLLDLKLFYTAQDAYNAMTCYGAEGRALYKRFLTADFIFALCYGLGFSLLFTRLLRAAKLENTVWATLNLLPLAIALADYMENVLMAGMLHIYPEQFPLTGTLAGIATSTKHVFIFVNVCGLLYLIVKILAQRIGGSCRSG